MKWTSSLCAFLLFAASIQAQINDGGSLPQSFEAACDCAPASPLPLHEASAQDWVRIRGERNSSKHGLYKVGQVLPLRISNQDASAGFSQQTQGGQLWRTRLRSAGAVGLSLYFSDFHLPEGATLHVYSANGRHRIGGFGAHNNQANRSFATEIVYAEEIIVEYFEPNNAAFSGTFTIEGLGHIFEGTRPAFAQDAPAQNSGGRDFGDALSCEVNVNCSEGTGRTGQRDAVARILIKVGADLGWCSGAVVNNTAQDCTPYFLTALHCGTTGTGALTTAADIDDWVFYFNYQSSGCSDPFLEPVGNTITGATVSAHSNDGGGDTGSDFLLLELSSTPPTIYNVYYAGWNRNNTAPAGGYGIHHPAGDIKKISTYDTNTSSGAWGTAIGSHWNVEWITTANGGGITEGGSSGSPIFNNSGLVVGTLTGGASSCASPEDGDVYGKMSYHWGSNGAIASRRLSDWLDANATGATTLSGGYCSGGSVNVDRYEHNVALDWSIAPNPSTTGMTRLAAGELGAEMQASSYNLEVVDALGRRVYGAQYAEWSQIQSAELDLRHLASGVYFLRIQTARWQAVQRLQLLHK